MSVAGRILVVDRDREVAELLVDHLTGEGYAVSQISSLDEALKAVDDDGPDLVLLDLDHSSGDRLAGLDAMREIYWNFPDVGVIVMSADDSVALAHAALALGALDYVFKPFDLDRVSRAILLGRIRMFDPADAFRRRPLEPRLGALAAL
jgi:two-component system nitrogen regulation response regulator GlnG